MTNLKYSGTLNFTDYVYVGVYVGVYVAVYVGGPACCLMVRLVLLDRKFSSFVHCIHKYAHVHILHNTMRRLI